MRPWIESEVLVFKARSPPVNVGFFNRRECVDKSGRKL
jgi:hypothetical protein